MPRPWQGGVTITDWDARSGPSQLLLGRAEGLPTESVANFDDLITVPKSMLVRRIGSLGPRGRELCETLRGMADC